MQAFITSWGVQLPLQRIQDGLRQETPPWTPGGAYLIPAPDADTAEASITTLLTLLEKHGYDMIQDVQVSASFHERVVQLWCYFRQTPHSYFR